MKSLCWLHFHSWLAELSRYLDSYRKRCMWRKNASHEGLHAYSHFQESLERFLVFLQGRPGLNYIIDSFTNSSLFVMYLYSIHLLVAYILMIGYFSSFRESFRAFSRLKKKTFCPCQTCDIGGLLVITRRASTLFLCIYFEEMQTSALF